MTTEGSIARPQAVRRPNARTLVPLAGLLGVVIVTTALIGLFGLHYAHKGYKADMHRVEAMMIRLDEARGAQVHFKKQVQEWKNLLLRGGDPAEYRRYFDAFVAEEAEVVRHLGNLDDDGAAAGPITVRSAAATARRWPPSAVTCLRQTAGCAGSTGNWMTIWASSPTPSGTRCS